MARLRPVRLTALTEITSTEKSIQSSGEKNVSLKSCNVSVLPAVDQEAGDRDKVLVDMKKI